MVNNKKEDKNITHKNYFDLLSILALLIGIIIRFVKAYKLPITYDEAYTFLHYANQPINIILSSYTYPNNHLFNSILMHFLLNFGNSEFLIRIPALIGSILFLTTIYMILNLLPDKRIRPFAMALIAIQPFLVDFGSLARGYSLGIAFSFMGFYPILSLLIKKHDPAHHWKALLISALCFILAMTAVPIFVNMIAAIFILIFLIDCIHRSPFGRYQLSLSRSYNIFLFMPTILGVFLIYINIFKELTHQQFVFGSTYFIDSLKNFIANGLLYGVTDSDILIIITLIICVIALLWLIVDGIRSGNRGFYIIGIIPFLSICLSLLEHYLFDMAYPMDRVMIYFIPFMLIALAYLLITLIDIGKKYIKLLNHQYAIFSITVLLIVSTLSLNSTKYFLTWKNNAAVKPIMRTLINKNNADVVICIPWQLDACFYYYKIRYRANFIQYNCIPGIYDTIVEVAPHITSDNSDPRIIYESNSLGVVAKRVTSRINQ